METPKAHEMTVEELYNCLSELQDTDRILINRFNNVPVQDSDGNDIGELTLYTDSYARYLTLEEIKREEENTRQPTQHKEEPEEPGVA